MFKSMFSNISYWRSIRRKHLTNIRSIQSAVLGIETSCDDTGIAIIAENGNILSDVCASQTTIHVSNGGIIPPVARDLHRSVIDSSVRKCLEEAKISPKDLSAIAVTTKPGLPLSLIVGCVYAKKLSAKYNIPVIPIHHMEAHALTAMIEYPIEKLDFPFLTLLISGGHCLITYVTGVNNFQLMGYSIDDAPGDILDKTARALRLKNLGQPYNAISGGAAIELMAKDGDPFSHFERSASHPMYSSRLRTCNFSFSGFLTGILRHIDRLENEIDLPPDKVLPQAPDLCASILYVISFTLIKRLQRAYEFLDRMEIWPESIPKRLVVSGGCAANKFITNTIGNYCKHEGIDLFIPSTKLCTDNGVMIAWNGLLKLKHEHLDPHLILRNQDQIQQLEFTSKAPLGCDISKQVTDANIKCERINVKSFVNFV
ncbi:putative tRNA N6-adenosine threonylcarbamoyltransferase, mitochondrial [Blomia tropicalis]|nr:putative tRNA N6-adenosine threonylcarbamoyltransferase, mitochondrial [Blomia tropicalis]